MGSMTHPDSNPPATSSAITAMSLVRMSSPALNGTDSYTAEVVRDSDCPLPIDDVLPTDDAVRSVGAATHVHTPPDGDPGNGDRRCPNRLVERQSAARQPLEPWYERRPKPQLPLP